MFRGLRCRVLRHRWEPMLQRQEGPRWVTVGQRCRWCQRETIPGWIPSIWSTSVVTDQEMREIKADVDRRLLAETGETVQIPRLGRLTDETGTSTTPTSGSICGGDVRVSDIMRGRLRPQAARPSRPITSKLKKRPLPTVSDAYIVERAVNGAATLKFPNGRCEAWVDLGKRWPDEKGKMHQCRKSPLKGRNYCNSHKSLHLTLWQRLLKAYRERKGK